METRKIVVKIPLKYWKYFKSRADKKLIPVGTLIRQLIMKWVDESDPEMIKETLRRR